MGHTLPLTLIPVLVTLSISLLLGFTHKFSDFLDLFYHLPPFSETDPILKMSGSWDKLDARDEGKDETDPSKSTPASGSSPTTPPLDMPSQYLGNGTTTLSLTGTRSPSPNTGLPDQQIPSSASTGAIAGAAVGCLIAGLLLGALLAFFILRKANRNRDIHTPTELTHITDIPGSKSMGAPPSASHGNDIQLSQFLLDATPDKEIAGELQSLGELVQQHVESHYHMRPVQASPQALAPVLQSLGLGNLSGLAPEAIAALCIDPKTRQIGLRHVISLMVFGSTDFNSPSRFSMLPASVASFTQSMPPVEPRSGDSHATSLALSKWRSLTAFLLHPSRSQRLPLSPIEAEVAPQAQSLAAALNTYLHHFVPADQGRQHQQLDHLQAVILECTKLGYEILSQPSDWRYVYSAGDAGAAGGLVVVVCPGLDKLTSKDGKVYKPPHRMAAPSVAQLAHSSR